VPTLGRPTPRLPSNENRSALGHRPASMFWHLLPTQFGSINEYTGSSPVSPYRTSEEQSRDGLECCGELTLPPYLVFDRLRRVTPAPYYDRGVDEGLNHEQSGPDCCTTAGPPNPWAAASLSAFCACACHDPSSWYTTSGYLGTHWSMAMPPSVQVLRRSLCRHAAGFSRLGMENHHLTLW
jgi:hypothetical protein